MSPNAALFGPYPAPRALDASWSTLVDALHGQREVVGASVQGRPLSRLTVGQGPRTVLLSALMHGVEVIGALAALTLVRRLADGSVRSRRLLDAARFVIVPVVNPDAYEANMGRLAAGERAGQRGNARRVDLNRNFPADGQKRSLHPFSGSSFAFSPHYRGPHALSEPESRALAEVAAAAPPDVSLAFHSFGNLLLYPHAHTFAPHPRADEYRALGRALNAGMPLGPYTVKPSAQLYPVTGDFDDHLDTAHGTLAMTVEVSELDRRLLHPRRLLNPFAWMNPVDVEGVCAPLAEGLLGLLEAALGVRAAPVIPLARAGRSRQSLELASKK